MTGGEERTAAGVASTGITRRATGNAERTQKLRCAGLLVGSGHLFNKQTIENDGKAIKLTRTYFLHQEIPSM